MSQLCHLGNYLLCILVISSNIFTTYFIYSIVSDYIEIYGKEELEECSKGLFIGLILGLYELFRVLGSLFWKKLSNFLGISISVNLSLLLLTITNIWFCFTSSLSGLILNRILAGLFNNLSTFSQQFILEIFNHKEHKKVIRLVSFYQNFGAVFAILSGLITEAEIADKNGHYNKYTALAVLVAFINIIALAFSLIKFRFRMVLPKRCTQFQEENFNMDLSQRRESNLHTNMKNNDIANNNHLYELRRSNSSLKNPNKETQQMKKKVEVSELDIKEGIDMHMNMNMHMHSNSNRNSNTLDQIEQNSSNLSQVEKIDKPKEIENKTPVEGQDKYIKLMEESHMSHNKHNDVRLAHSRINNLNSDYQSEEKKETEPNDPDGSSPPVSHIQLKPKTKAKFYNKNPHFQLNEIDDNQIKVADTPTNALKSPTFEMRLKTFNDENPYFSIFKISSIFSILQICDIVLYNVLLMNLLLDKTKGIFEFSLYLSLFHFITSLLSPIINSYLVRKYFKDIPKLKFTFNLFICLSVLITIATVVYDKSVKHNNTLYILIILILIRNLFLTSVLTCYNLLVFNLSSSALKEKIHSHQTYISFTLRSLVSILSCFAYDYFNDQYFMSIVCLGLIPVSLLMVNLKLIKSLTRLI